MTDEQRIGFIVGNWKMHKTISQSLEYTQAFEYLLLDTSHDIGLAVPFPSIGPVDHALKKSSIMVGAQNMHESTEGAFTGEVSAAMIVDAGAQFVILGHSERRHIMGESDATINRKVKAALHARLLPIFCIGETLKQREEGRTAEVLREQITNGLADLTRKELTEIVIAYEPVWAIGTGKSASPDEAQEQHKFCRALVEKHWDKNAAEKVRINRIMQLFSWRKKILMVFLSGEHRSIQKDLVKL